jgi:2-polyprenyl-3-methyl-5-hydroxy-6-metoxy-1,4-benzoquinol methylase
MKVQERQKYYDWSLHSDLEPEDGAPFSDWMADPNHPAPFALHPEGFRVFLRPPQIQKLDEYSCGDPYRVAARIDSQFHRQRIDTTLELLADIICKQSDSPKILDIGCGEGHISAAIQTQFPQAEVSAFDASLSAISRASRSYPHVVFEVANAYEPPYRPGYFDCVVCNNIWEHVPDPLCLLERVSRILRPDGYLVVSTPSRYNLTNLLRVLVGRPVALASCHHVTEYSVGQVIEQMRWGGFEVEKTAGNLVYPASYGVKAFIQFFLVAPLLTSLLKLSGSHHRLGLTVFYLARKVQGGL